MNDYEFIENDLTNSIDNIENNTITIENKREDYNNVIKTLVEKNNKLENELESTTEFLYVDNIQTIENYKNIINDLQKKNHFLEIEKNNILDNFNTLEYEYSILEKDLYDMECVNTELIKVIKT
tara:strand:- start:131 stop:502 length:372 start_codon:yes stop_codon:yes gene_type:complete